MLEHIIKKPEVNILNDDDYTSYAANGASINDSFIVTDSIPSLNFSHYTDTEIELFTGYPNIGHVPVYARFDIPTRSNNRETKFDLENTDWADVVKFWKKKPVNGKTLQTRYSIILMKLG